MLKKTPEKTSKDTQAEQLNAVLMSFIHDIKNSLLVSLSGLDSLYDAVDNLLPEQKNSFNQIQYELRRINNSLIQLLSLYKMETQLFSIQADQYNCYDFLDELIISNKPLNKQTSFSFKLDCDQDIEWFFDRDLIATIINSTINNSIRYTHSEIILTAKINDNNFLEICIEDDGDGFPEKMFTHPENLETVINMKSGSTGLGLYFAEKIANIHQNGEKEGTIFIDNQSQIGGGRFTLFLP
ncbi:MAG: HAMP domain-containing histidine kinase [gamma proteobacterium symbiont of Taylorina sp.]|nr:HAMP domain-containing histidine kinase [gamma proteobacterium symbiont of Taylorina sp.]